MTRINVGVKPKELPNKFLIAEHREIVRIPNAIKSGRFVMTGQPIHFCLGTGHVKFFYDKLEYLRKRYVEIYTELRSRGVNVTDMSSAWDGIEQCFMNDYAERPEDREIIRKRLLEKGYDLE